jgi:hypothetical protein|tara:strand:+ start:605 stop:994 length:390 start_codon:yes stop_codon:yes gene_type:complete
MKVNLITPPDILYNNTYSIVLVSANNLLKNELQSHIEKFNINFNIYVLDNENIDINWLLTCIKIADIVIFDIDNADDIIKNFTSYIIGHDNVFWLTNREYLYYTSISVNRKYNLDFLQEVIGGYIEKQE